MNIFSNKGDLKISNKPFQQMEALMSSLYVAFGKDESFFQSMFALLHVFAITQGVKGAYDVHNVAQEASTKFGFL
jgi:hypothetical protein